VQLQVWPGQLMWQRGDLALPVQEQRGDKVRLPAALRVTSWTAGLGCKIEGRPGGMRVLNQHDVVAVDTETDHRLVFRHQGSLPRLQELAGLQPGQVLDVQVQEHDFTIDPQWDRYLGRKSARSWGTAATWTGGIVTAAAGVALLVAMNYEASGDSAALKYRSANDTRSAKQLRTDSTDAYANGAMWRNVAGGSGATGSALLLTGVGMLLGLPGLPEPGQDNANAGGEP
jgi:hypothetical protein